MSAQQPGFPCRRTRKCNEGRMAVVSGYIGLSIPYFPRIRSTGKLQRPARKTRQKRLIGRPVYLLDVSGRTSRYTCIKNYYDLPMNFCPHPRLSSTRIFSPREVSGRSPSIRLTYRGYPIVRQRPARSNHSYVIQSTRPLSSEAGKLFIDGAERITT